MPHPLTNQELAQVTTANENFIRKAKRAGQFVTSNVNQQNARLSALKKTAKNRKGRHR